MERALASVFSIYVKPRGCDVRRDEARCALVLRVDQMPRRDGVQEITLTYICAFRPRTALRCRCGWLLIGAQLLGAGTDRKRRENACPAHLHVQHRAMLLLALFRMSRPKQGFIFTINTVDAM
jgi:hypothetical protein